MFKRYSLCFVPSGNVIPSIFEVKTDQMFGFGLPKRFYLWDSSALIISSKQTLSLRVLSETHRIVLLHLLNPYSQFISSTHSTSGITRVLVTVYIWFVEWNESNKRIKC